MQIKSNQFWNHKVVAVTGASGFLGSHFVKELTSLGARVISLTRSQVNLLDLEQTRLALSGVEIVFNCAALDGNAEFKKNHAVEILDGNFRLNANVLLAAKENHISDVVIISSAEIYSSYAPNPIKEDDDYRVYGGHSTSGYILSKRYSEILAELYQEQFNFRIYLPRPSNIFGPGDHFSDESTRVIPSFISKISAGQPIEIWGDGSQIRQFVYVQDVVYTVLSMVENQKTGKLNIAGGEFISVHQLAIKISQLLNLQADIRLDKTKSVGSKSRVLDNSKMLDLVQFSPRTLESGLQETISWYQTKYR